MASKKKLSFEEGMQSLNDLISQIESGDMPLEKSFDTYEQGMKLVGELKDILDAGEKRLTNGKTAMVTELVGAMEVPFAEDENERT